MPKFKMCVTQKERGRKSPSNIIAADFQFTSTARCPKQYVVAN